MTRHLILLLCGVSTLVGCTKEPPRPRTVSEFVDNPIMLEAAMIRCAADRSRTRYDAECINARQAVDRIQAKEEAANAAALEAASESKRKALRRTQQAAAEARRRAAEEMRLREEAEYLQQLGVAPPGDGEPNALLPEGNAPGAVVNKAADGGNAPVVETEPESPETETDLESIRDELRRRNDEGEN